MTAHIISPIINETGDRTMLPSETLATAADSAVRSVPPVWPLASSVAVNPFLGQAHETLAQAGARLQRVAGLRVTMPRQWYADKIASGAITDADLAAALAKAPKALRPADVAAVKAGVQRVSPEPAPVPTVADLAAEATGTDWPGLIAERFGAWAAGYFDEGQALWAAPKGRDAYDAWRDVATHDLTPEIMGLTGFARHVASAPQRADELIARATQRLGLPADALPTYYHALLMTLGGWAQVARYKLWMAELGDADDVTAKGFLAIRLAWEEALFELCGDKIAAQWEATRAAHVREVRVDADLVLDAVLQEAAERAAQRGLADLLAQPAMTAATARPSLQAAFCIDVRSEVFRRALEDVDPGIRTSGFAGFFGLATAHHGFASDVEELRLPVLLNPGVHSASGGPDDKEKDQTSRFLARATRAWGRFKLAAVSSFAFVEAMGPVYVVKLVRDALGIEARAVPGGPAPRLTPALDPAQRIDAANTVLRAMSLTQDFARVVVLAGHGANVVNNPHASALHCGACGGYSGEVNARLLAALLSDTDVRAGVAEKGVVIPEDTLFVAALHDTTTDTVTLYDEDCPAPDHADDLRKTRDWLAAAGVVSRAERALRLPRADGAGDIARRSRDWSETRAEWGLAGCRAFIAAPRVRTKGKGLAGQAFLHDYEWQSDEGFGILELIMTAPVVVASWISLQYYGSSVAPQAFGGGNKLLHNVVGGIGVVEGNGGLLRAGLPWQSVHDGEGLQHDPLRLSVCIEAPREAMSDILERHPGVRELFDNGWLHLFALDENGHMAWRYAGDLDWEAFAA